MYAHEDDNTLVRGARRQEHAGGNAGATHTSMYAQDDIVAVSFRG